MSDATITSRQSTSHGALLVTIPDAARILAVGRSTIYELIGSGQLATVHIGRAVRVPVEELRRLVDRRVLVSDDLPTSQRSRDTVTPLDHTVPTRRVGGSRSR
jgi:excisionase family DNA binding protein